MELDGHLDPEFCKEIIEKFDLDPNRQLGTPAHRKVSIDLSINWYSDWNPITEKLNILIKDGLTKYIEWLQVMLPYINPELEHSKNTGFQIQKSGKYGWHDDSLVEEEHERVLTFIWYLNTIDEGGETDLVYKKVKPRTGKLLIFPSTWNYVHRGIETENKYIITGWFYRAL